jgi:uncharacterized protein
VTQVGDRIWLVSFMRYDLGYFDNETCRLEPIENPFGPRVLPICVQQAFRECGSFDELQNERWHSVRVFKAVNVPDVEEGEEELLFIVQFEDKPGVSDTRQALLASHVEFLDRVKDRVLVPGSIREIPSDRPLGGLWIVEAESEAEVRDIFKDDPFWLNGLRASVRINRWQKAFPDRTVPI